MERKLTVSYLVQRSPFYNVYYPTEHKDKTVPKITMSGAWLEKAGFSTGDKVQVIVEENRIVLKRLQ